MNVIHEPLLDTKYEPRREKTCLRDFEPGKTHTGTGTLFLETMQGFDVPRAIIQYVKRSTTETMCMYRLICACSQTNFF